MDNSVIKPQSVQSVDIKLKVLRNLASIISGLQKAITLTEQELPVAYIDSQVVWEYITDTQYQKGETINDIPYNIVNEATTTLDYLESTPIVKGLYFWEKLDCEPLEYYRLFKTYRDINPITNDTKRSFEKLAVETNTDIAYIYEYSKIYHWRQRTKSFDLYQKQIIGEERNRLTKIMENNHHKAANKIFDIASTYLDTLNSSGLIAQASPKEILGWAEFAVKLERLSLGLNPDKPDNLEDNKNNNNSKPVTQNQTNIVSINSTQNILDKDAEGNILDVAEKAKYLQDVINALTNAKALPTTLQTEVIDVDSIPT